MTRRQIYEVLLIEDDMGDAELAKMAFAQSPFSSRITQASNGKDAMKILLKQPPHAGAPTPDLVLLDLNMPLMSGQEVLAAIKADPDLTRIPVVVMTTSDVERDVVASYTLGAAGYITKPMEIEELFKIIHEVQAYWFSTVRRPERTK